MREAAIDVKVGALARVSSLVASYWAWLIGAATIVGGVAAVVALFYH